jgi:arylsulfatase
VIAQGGRFGGWALYLHDRRPVYCYNFVGLQLFKVCGDTQVESGDHQLRMEFAYDGGGLAKGGLVTLFVDGQPVGSGRVEATQPMIFSGDETTDLGSDTGTGVSDDYTSETSKFTGRVQWVQIDIDESAEDVDHLITPEERLRIAMARQ